MNQQGTSQSGQYCIGIDLGTTNTTVSISRVNQNGIIILEDIAVYQAGGRKDEIVPSILFVGKDGKELVGQPALDRKKSHIASSGESPRYIENAKRYIGDNRIWEIDGKRYNAVYVAEQILRCVRREARIKECIDVADVFITTPANFETDQINNTLEAAKRAGFGKAQLQSEPKAAILSFLHEEQGKAELKQLNLSKKQRILVIDIGGGTCDICVEDVCENANHEYSFEHIAVGRENIGGVDFDRRLAVALVEKYKLDQLSDMDFAKLVDLGQTFKETFSGRIMAVLMDVLYDEYDGDETAAFEDQNWRHVVNLAEPVVLSRKIGGQDIFFEMNGQEFCDAVLPLIYGSDEITISNKDDYESAKNMKSLIQNTLNENQIDASSVDVLFLTGGMSLCFVLKAALYEIFHKKIVCPDKPLQAVSRGAALMNKYQTSDLASHDIMPRSIMIETNTGELKKLIAAGEQVPVSKTVDKIFTTTSRNGVQIKLFEGADEFDNQLKKLRSVYSIHFESPMNLGREFQIKYDIDRTRRIKFSIIFLDDNSEYHDIEAKYSEAKE